MITYNPFDNLSRKNKYSKLITYLDWKCLKTQLRIYEIECSKFVKLSEEFIKFFTLLPGKYL